MRKKKNLLSGQAALEVAVLLIPFLLCIGLVYDGSRLFLAYSEANAAASDIARLAASQASNGSSIKSGSSPESDTFDVNAYAANMGLPADARVEVKLDTGGIDSLDGLSYRIEVDSGDGAADGENSDEDETTTDKATAVDVYAKTASVTCRVGIPVDLLFPLWGVFIPGISEDLSASSFLVTAEAVAYTTASRTGEAVS